MNGARPSKRLEERLLVDVGVTKDPTNRVSAHRPMERDNDEVRTIGMNELPVAPPLLSTLHPKRPRARRKRRPSTSPGRRAKSEVHRDDLGGKGWDRLPRR